MNTLVTTHMKWLFIYFFCGFCGCIKITLAVNSNLWPALDFRTSCSDITCLGNQLQGSGLGSHDWDWVSDDIYGWPDHSNHCQHWPLRHHGDVQTASLLDWLIWGMRNHSPLTTARLLRKKLFRYLKKEAKIYYQSRGYANYAASSA